jgi:hypothetical protein
MHNGELLLAETQRTAAEAILASTSLGNFNKNGQTLFERTIMDQRLNTGEMIVVIPAKLIYNTNKLSSYYFTQLKLLLGCSFERD